MRYLTATLVIVAVISLFSAFYFASQSKKAEAEYANIPTPTNPRIEADKLFSLVNAWRVSQGYQPYTIDNRLCNLASQRLIELKQGGFSHEGFYKHFNDFHYRDLAENLIQGEFYNEKALQEWLRSPGHRSNLNFAYSYSCLKSDGYNAVQIFANF